MLRLHNVSRHAAISWYTVVLRAFISQFGGWQGVKTDVETALSLFPTAMIFGAVSRPTKRARSYSCPFHHEAFCSVTHSWARGCSLLGCVAQTTYVAGALCLCHHHSPSALACVYAAFTAGLRSQVCVYSSTLSVAPSLCTLPQPLV